MNFDLDYTDDHSDETITRQDVAERVSDWLERLAALYSGVSRWAENAGWELDESGSVTMDEEPMQRFDIGSRAQPTLRLTKNGDYALFVPKGLWVIGANGRIDLFTSRGVYLLIDKAEPFETPKWTIFRSSDRLEGEVFVPEAIERLV